MSSLLTIEDVPQSCLDNGLASLFTAVRDDGSERITCTLDAEGKVRKIGERRPYVSGSKYEVPADE